MNVLFITAFPPNELTAGQDYSRRLIVDLCNRGYSVSLIYFSYNNHSIVIPNTVSIIKKNQSSLRNCFGQFSYHPFFTKRFDNKTLSLLQTISSKYDILYFDFSQVHLYSLYINHPYKILMCHDIISQKYSRINRLQLPWIRYSENIILRSARKVVTFSQKDSLLLQKLYKIQSSSVNFYLKGERSKITNVPLAEDMFCFYGAWNRKENYESLIWFLSNIYPKIEKATNFVIIGGGLHIKLQKKLLKYKNIKYLGFIDDPLIEISRCQAIIAPLHKGAGVKVKVIDALTSGTPVIGTKIAFEGISDNIINKLLFEANTNSNFIHIINNWITITADYKTKASQEFITKYDTNHLPDLLSEW